MLPNCPQYIISYFGIVAAGGIVTQVNPMLVEQELEHILNDSGAKKIILLDDFYTRLQEIRNRVDIEEAITVSLQKPFVPTSPDLSFLDFFNHQA